MPDSDKQSGSLAGRSQEQVQAADEITPAEARKPLGAYRPSGMLIAVGFMLVLSAAVGLSIRNVVNDAHRDVVFPVPSLPTGGERVTAIAWSSITNVLLVGTQSGRLYRVDGVRSPQEVPAVAKGPIVAIYPVAGAADSARTVWLDPMSEGSGTPYRAEESPASNGLAVLAGSALRAIGETSRATDILNGGKAAPQKAAPGPSQGINTPFNDNEISAVGSISIFEPLPDSAGRGFSDVTVLGYRDGSLRLINNADNQPIRTLDAEIGADKSQASGAGSRSVIAIASRRDLIAQRRDSSRSNIGAGAALFATASANGEVSIIRSGGLLRVQRIAMGTEAPPGDPATKSSATPATPIHPGKDGLVLSEDGGILMIYGREGVALANLAESPQGAEPPALWRFTFEEPLAVPSRQFISATENLQDDINKLLQKALGMVGVNSDPIAGIVSRTTEAMLANFKKALSVADSRAACKLTGQCPGRISAAALSPRGDFFAVAGDDHVIRVVTLPSDLRDLSKVQPFPIRGHGDVITQLAISPDGHYLASTGIDGRLWITNIDRARQMARWPLHDLPSGPVAPEMSPVPIGPLDPAANEERPIVTLSADNTLLAAQAEIARATAAGFKDLGIYRWGDTYNSVAKYEDFAAQQAALLELRDLPRWSRVAYPAFLSEQCPVAVAAQGFTDCTFPAAKR
jgi:hypothetical protein